MTGKVIKIISNKCYVERLNKVIECTLLGSFKYKKINVIVGDNVLIDEDKQVIKEVLPRVNMLKRPLIANIDICLIVMSLKTPAFSWEVLDKILCEVIYYKIKPVICLTKIDLDTDLFKRIREELKYYEKLEIKVVDNTMIKEIKEILANKTIVVAGNSGVGKSTLINKLGNLSLKTGDISKKVKRGKNTTIQTELYKIDNIMIADTPGFSSLELSELSKDDLKDTFKEFNNYECEYKDCNHINERNCKVKEHVNIDILESRYNNYKKFRGELK